MRSSILTSILAAALALAGCSAGTDHVVDDESTQGESDALSVYARKLIGAWRVETRGSFELDELVLESNGHFFWHHDIVCIKAPCPTRDEGKWIGYAPAKGEAQGRIRLTSRSEVRQYGVVIGVDGTLELSRFGASAKLDPIGTYCETVADCDGQPNLIMVKCAGGYHSEPVCDPKISCSKTCVKDAPSTAPCMKTGCSGEICSDKAVISACMFRPEYACFAAATCARNDAGACAWSSPTLDACLASGGACTYSDPKKRYVGTSKEKCMVIRYACDFAASETFFSDDCGCGCLSK
jgi:hypothetical protein